MARKKETDIIYNETVYERSLDEVMHQSMMPYAEHVILERALPRVEDGLKPVQRRILYTMHELSMTPDKPHRKSARIVGDCLGKFHPHGESSVYDAMVRMAQEFSTRGLLVDGHGNFGSVDGDPPAAMRYTEARMTPLALELLRDLEKETVSWRFNFDDTLKEPEMLPGRFPNLLVNGASGIAVGLATNIPPHNLGEAIDAVIAMIDEPDITLEKIMRVMPGPDFPTGGILMNDAQIAQAYATGRGRLTLRAKTDIEPGASGRNLIVITELPYQVNKASMLEKILNVTEEKKIGGIADIRDESDRTGMRAVIELKKDTDPERMLAWLYKYADLQVTFGVNIVAIVGGKPAQLGILEVIRHYVAYQKDVVTRRTRFDLEAAEKRLHILEGLIIAVDNLDAVIALIRASKNVKEAREGLMATFGLTEPQAQAVLDLRLQRLTGLEILTLRKEYAEVQKLIAGLRAILADERKLMTLIKQELGEVKERFADARRTVLQAPGGTAAASLVLEEAPPAEDVVLVLTHGMTLKRLAPKAYDKHEDDEAPAEADLPRLVLRGDTSQKLLLLTDKGACHAVPVSEIPACRPKDRGAAITGIIELEADERLADIVLLPAGLTDEQAASLDMLMMTKGGQVKRTALSEYITRMRKVAAINLRAGDEVLAAIIAPADEDMTLLLITERGQSIAFAEGETPRMGRATAGVRGMTLEPGDRVLFAARVSDEGELLLATDRGYLKRSLLCDFERQARGGKGVRVWSFAKSKSDGARIAAAATITLPYTAWLLQHGGAITRVSTEEVPIKGRSDKGAPFVLCLMDQVMTHMGSLEG